MSLDRVRLASPRRYPRAYGGLPNRALAERPEGGVLTIVGNIFIVLAGLGSLYTLVSAWLVGRYRASPVAPRETWPAITVLKPLCGAEPRLADNLATLFAQEYRGSVQLIFGVGDAEDPAHAIARELCAAHPRADCTVIVDPHRHGTNNKMSNVINMGSHIQHEIVVLADSDVAWAPDTLVRLADALADPTVGIASCLHTGRGDAGFWSVLGAMDISYRFLPSIALGIASGLAKPCLGPTMAFRRDALDAVGGFAAFADVLADDHALGTAIAATGLRSVVPAFTIIHSCDERSLVELARHELRWTRTIFGIDRWGFAGSVITHCLALGLIGAILTGFSGHSLRVLGLALGTRGLLKLSVDFVTRTRSGSLLLLPIRDVLSFVIFLITFFGDTVHWRGERYAVTRDGRLRGRHIHNGHVRK